MLNNVITILNGVLTIFCGLYLANALYKKKLFQNIFYISWAIGFFFYGIEIITRIFFGDIALFSFGTIAFLSISLGVWSIAGKQGFIIVIFIILSLIITISSHLVAPEIGLAVIYLVILGGIAYLRIYFGNSADKLFIGWIILLVTNVFISRSDWVSDVFAILSKITLFLGLFSEDFATLSEKLKRRESFGHQKQPSISSGTKEEGGITLIIPSNVNSMEGKINWIEKKIDENVKKNIDTYVFAFQDLPSHSELRRIKWISPSKVFIILFSSSSQKANEEFSVFNMDITVIGAVLSEITRKYQARKDGCDVIITDLSLLIIIFNANTLLNILLEKMGSLREAGLSVYAFFDPEIHNDSTIFPLFRNISNEVTKF